MFASVTLLTLPKAKNKHESSLISVFFERGSKKVMHTEAITGSVNGEDLNYSFKGEKLAQSITFYMDPSGSIDVIL